MWFQDTVDRWPWTAEEWKKGNEFYPSPVIAYGHDYHGALGHVLQAAEMEGFLKEQAIELAELGHAWDFYLFGVDELTRQKVHTLDQLEKDFPSGVSFFYIVKGAAKKGAKALAYLGEAVTEAAIAGAKATSLGAKLAIWAMANPVVVSLAGLTIIGASAYGVYRWRKSK